MLTGLLDYSCLAYPRHESRRGTHERCHATVLITKLWSRETGQAQVIATLDGRLLTGTVIILATQSQ